MLPSSTVENYLKAIYQGAATLTPPQRLLPMGQLASALGVVPGTATTMVKALAESGLVEYEPYSGVALTPSGHKLAALVLRRHRLVELFLVRFMGYAWDEVHDEAEQLEHVVSDRLIDRMDEMLGRPEVDPHGDPIPDAEGQVKTLAESGLVQYEPYAGVALTPAGAKLAALVVRRHRVIEVFLVKVMGYRWDEVHDEAEQLEHVVSERLIDRMDEMLGRPEVDPHGDPIPDAEGIIKPQEAQNLLTCPLRTQVTVMRVLDQDKVFLRFIENHNLKPGESIEVEDRDAASDSVRVRGKDDQRITIGTRAASKLLVQVAR